MSVNVTAALEVRHWLAKVQAWIRGAYGDAGGHSIVWEHPHADEIGRPLHRINTATVAVEAAAVGLRSTILDNAAACLVSLVAVVRHERARLIDAGDGTLAACMQSGPIPLGVVHTFKNVNLTAIS